MLAADTSRSILENDVPDDLNRLFYGDCLTIMEQIPDQSVDLIYLDPPFNSNREYTAIYRDETGRPLPDQLEAFHDMWTLDSARMEVVRRIPIHLRECGIDDDATEFLQAMLGALRRTQPDMLAYLSYMVERLAVMRRLLRPDGTIYLHCDSTASHYLKIAMDALFRRARFGNEIVWRRINAKSNTTRNFPNNHEVLLRYTMSDNATWNAEYVEHDDEYIDKHYNLIEEGTGRRYQLGDLTNPNRNRPNLTYEFLGVTRVWRWTKARMQEAYERGLVVQTAPGRVPRRKQYLDEVQGKLVDDIWTDIDGLQKGERLGYDTQKPLELMERIIATSSNPGDLVLDPFCGCATTIEAAHRLDRRWIGIDIAIHAIRRVATVRLGDRCGLVEDVNFAIEGVPRSVEGAVALWQRDPYDFQKWAVEQIDGFVTTRRTADGGVDGRLYFAVPGEEQLQSMLVEVKGGESVGIGVLRQLQGVLQNDSAQMAGLILLNEPGQRQRRNFEALMADAESYDVTGATYPRLQLLTVREILEGARFRTPGVVGRGSTQRILPLPNA